VNNDQGHSENLARHFQNDMPQQSADDGGATSEITKLLQPRAIGTMQQQLPELLVSRVLPKASTAPTSQQSVDIHARLPNYNTGQTNCQVTVNEESFPTEVERARKASRGDSKCEDRKFEVNGPKQLLEQRELDLKEQEMEGDFWNWFSSNGRRSLTWASDLSNGRNS